MALYGFLGCDQMVRYTGLRASISERPRPIGRHSRSVLTLRPQWQYNSCGGAPSGYVKHPANADVSRKDRALPQTVADPPFVLVRV